jgi:glc operon protein GlcG
MPAFRNTISLAHAGALDAVAAAVAKADATGVLQCIVAVDGGGEMLAGLRMDDAKYPSLCTARAKARTAASIGGRPTA